VLGRAKGQGTKPYVVPLSEKATKALQEFARLDAWGQFTCAPMARMWKAAAAQAKLPPDAVPYDLRHSFGAQVFRATGDLKTAKEVLGHASLRTTERYMLAAVPQRRVTAIKAAFPARRRRPVAITAAGPKRGRGRKAG
jgi:site-specific recombinase XerD